MVGRQNLITGVTSSGSLHLGSYLGVMRRWQDYSEAYRCWFFIADMHAITTVQPPKELHARTLDMAAMFLAMQLDPKHNTFFIQSHVPEHAELAWVMSCLANMGEMARMTQYKDKSQQTKQVATLGLYSYPCLMAADILLYDAHCVPVGEDQKQHLELTRNLAQRFNRDFDDIFVVPEPHIPKTCARVMALQEPNKKMSKSDSNLNNSIYLLDDEKTICKKIKRAVTDSQGDIRYDTQRPGLANLLDIYANLSGQSIQQIEEVFNGQGYAVFKQALSQRLVDEIIPLQERYYAIRADEPALLAQLYAGAQLARAQAAQKLQEVYRALGFVPYGK